MRVALVSSRIMRGHGQGRVNYEIAQYALEAGCSLTLLASEVDPELAARNEVTWVQIKVGNLPTEMLRNQVFAAASALWLAPRRRHHDIVHADGFSTWVAADVNTAHFVHSTWLSSPYFSAGPGVRGAYHWAYFLLNSRLERLAFSAARRVVAVSMRTKEELLAIGVPSEAIRVIRNGVDLNEFSSRENVENEHAYRTSQLTALFVGDIRSYRKNLDTVLHALVLAPEVKLLVAGDTRGSPFLALTERLGLQERVRFLGACSDVPGLMRAADVLVFPSRYETCGLVILEALASGLPVVTAKTAGGFEIVVEAGGIVLEDPNDAIALSRSLAELQHSPKRRRDLSISARATAEAHSWSAMAHSYIKLYHELARGAPWTDGADD